MGEGMALRSALIPFCIAAFATFAPRAEARDFLVVRDDGARVAEPDGPNLFAMRASLLEAYEAAGLPMPEVLSVWTTFPMNGSDFGTYIDPRANDVTGIGLEETFPPDGTKESQTPPLRAILWHNNVRALPERASLHRASEDGYGRYLFLLELSHLWGPDIAVPAPDPAALIGFSYHWSFFSDQPSPAGGNEWIDNGDGTFTVVPGEPSTVAFNPLDLYLMGLAPPDEVPPFGVLDPTEVPAAPSDPFWGGTFAARSFPWFDELNPPMTVTATRRTLTIDDVIAANGPRVPASGSKSSWTLGVVLVVPEDATDAELDAAAQDFEPFASQLAPAFADATAGLGSLEVVSIVEEPGEGGSGGGGSAAGGAGGSGEGGAGGGEPPASDEGCSCSTLETTEGDSLGWGAALAFAVLGLARGSSRARRRT
jgi:hypothetical protein